MSELPLAEMAPAPLPSDARRLSEAGRAAIAARCAPAPSASTVARRLREQLALYQRARKELATGTVAEFSLYRRDLGRNVMFDSTMLRALDQQIAVLSRDLGLPMPDGIAGAPAKRRLA